LPTRRDSTQLGPPTAEVGTHRFYAPIRTQVPSSAKTRVTRHDACGVPT
jgi:hypothetical protein